MRVNRRGNGFVGEIDQQFPLRAGWQRVEVWHKVGDPQDDSHTAPQPTGSDPEESNGPPN